MSLKEQLAIIGAASEAKRLADIIADRMSKPWAMDEVTFLVAMFDSLSNVAREGAKAVEEDAREQDNAPEVEL